MNLRSERDRLRDYAGRWSVTLDDASIETASSLIGFGIRRDRRVVLKIAKRPGDEWLAGSVTRAFHGRAVVRVLELDDGAVLLERAIPGTSLVDVVAAGDDDRATSIIGGIMRDLAPGEPPTGTPTVEAWGRAFERYRASGDRHIPSSLIDGAHRLYEELCISQTNRRLLHGDLQHSNILFDDDRGWIAIDPKGVIGEPEVEVGPFLRNPTHAVELFNNPIVVERRLHLLCTTAGLRYERAVRWAFALAVLSAIWTVEDDGVVQDDNPALILAGALRASIERASS
jgi:streptomycin 6-kinase